MVSKYNLKNKLRVAIVAVNQRITGALKMAGLASSFLDYTKGNGDINPHLNNLASLCHILLIYPSDLFHPSFRNINTKCIPHPPRPALKNFIITDDDFAKTLSLVDDIKFDQSFSFIYSKRPGTPAAVLEDPISAEVKKSRLYTLQARLEEYALTYSQKMLNTRQRVLIEGVSRKDANELKGRASNNRIVVFEGSTDLIGSMVDVDIIKVMSHTL